MDAVLENPNEIVVFDPNRIRVLTNEYADELRFEINKNVPGINARIESDEPRVVIREREL